MPKPPEIELPGAEPIRILYEDRGVLAIDKPPGWMLVPDSWQHTTRNLQAALVSSIRAGDFWARSRNLKYLRFVHRLDAETSGVLLLAKNPRGLAAYSRLFEQHSIDKTYLALVTGAVADGEWTCRAKLGPDRSRPGKMKVDAAGQDAETRFVLLACAGDRSLVQAFPRTGRTHQIRVHLAHAGHPVIGDALYGTQKGAREGMALRAVSLAYVDPFTRRRVRISAPHEEFLRSCGFQPGAMDRAEPSRSRTGRV